MEDESCKTNERGIFFFFAFIGLFLFFNAAVVSLNNSFASLALFLFSLSFLSQELFKNMKVHKAEQEKKNKIQKKGGLS